MDPWPSSWPSSWPVVVDLSRGSAARPEHAAAAADTYPDSDFDPDPAVAATDTDSDADFDADGGAGAGVDPVVVSGVWEVELGRVLSVWWRRVCPGWVDPGRQDFLLNRDHRRTSHRNQSPIKGSASTNYP